MGKAKLRKKEKGLLKQTKKHIEKFKEAKKRGDTGSMNYMAREMSDYVKNHPSVDGWYEPYFLLWVVLEHTKIPLR